MIKMVKVPNSNLLNAGLGLMRAAGKPLQKIPSRGRSMIYKTTDNKTVRVRTCNDHILVVLAEREDESARLNIEGTDFLLIVMAETPRKSGGVLAYLVPTQIAVEAARAAHKEWLATNPNTKGNNRTWNIWFGDDGPAKANGFARKWVQFKLSGAANTDIGASSSFETGPTQAPMKLGDIIARAKQQIAEVAGVSPDAVRISVDLT